MITEDLQRHIGKYYGKYSGEVADNADDEFRGRIMVKVPSIFGPDLTVRARPCLPFGHFYIPAISAKVWVEFEAGDPQYPIWVGVWYPQDSTPEQAQVDPPDNRVIATPSGHIIEVMDKDGEEKITIKHKDNSFISIDSSGSVVISDHKGSHLYFNAEDDEATLMSKQGHMVTMNDGGLALINSDGAAFDLQGDTARITAKTILLEAQTVSVGKGADDKLIKATQFNTLWNLVMTHTHPSAMGPTGVPVPPILPLVEVQHFTAAVTVK